MTQPGIEPWSPEVGGGGKRFMFFPEGITYIVINITENDKKNSGNNEYF